MRNVVLVAILMTLAAGSAHAQHLIADPWAPANTDQPDAPAPGAGTVQIQSDGRTFGRATFD